MHLNEIVTGLRRVEATTGRRPLRAGDPRARAIPPAPWSSPPASARSSPASSAVEGEERFEERGLYYKVLDPQLFAGKRVLIVGGGDSAFDWVVNLQDIARSDHADPPPGRLPGPRGHHQAGAGLPANAASATSGPSGRSRRSHGDDRLERVTIVNTKTKEEETLRGRRGHPAARLSLRHRRHQGVGARHREGRHQGGPGDVHQRSRHLRRG